MLTISAVPLTAGGELIVKGRGVFAGREVVREKVGGSEMYAIQCRKTPRANSGRP